MPDVYDWQKQGAFIYDWETQSGEERAELMRASTVNRLKGTVLNLAAAVSAIDVDVALLKADHANTT
ncbi:MAG TPA: hypothetical protein VD706_02855, partial [Candidatus Saccharimonadales bacterium]|nr:hypothetical protein [Candidatus Saccharimonadales bacterium]